MSKKIQQDCEEKVKTNEEKDTNDLSSTGDESEDGQSSVSHKDQDSDVSFESDNDEVIDATEIEEEDWVDHIKRSTDEAIDKMGKREDSMLNQDAQKNEMANDTENRISTK